MKEDEVLQIVRNNVHGSGLDLEQYDFELREGRGRYNKIVMTYVPQGSKSAYAFQDKLTGHILKAASWSAPARTAIYINK